MDSPICGVNTVSDRNTRAAGQNRGLVWTATACITVSLLVMIAISVAGPSISVPAMAHTSGGPPWWVSLGLPEVCVIAGTLIDGPATEITIITRSETVMQAAAVQTNPRFLPAARVFRSLTVFTPQMG